MIRYPNAFALKLAAGANRVVVFFAAEAGFFTDLFFVVAADFAVAISISLLKLEIWLQYNIPLTSRGSSATIELWLYL